jgi:hypothetical protein
MSLKTGTRISRSWSWPATTEIDAMQPLPCLTPLSFIYYLQSRNRQSPSNVTAKIASGKGKQRSNGGS